MVGRVFLALTAAAASTAMAQYPLNCDLEPGFDYAGNDIKNVQGPLESCCDACASTIVGDVGCSVWTWTNYNNGTCWLKKEGGAPVVNANAKSARNLHRYFMDAGYYYTDLDFAGNDIGSAKAAKFQDCWGICKNTLGCRAYAWNNYQGGTCWLKSKRGDSILYKPGTVSAEAYKSGEMFTPTRYGFEYGVDYVGNDFASVSGVPVTKCGELCTQRNVNIDPEPKCHAFSWSSYQGGTCWLKTGRNKTTANSGVTSAVAVTAVQP